jgi:hypothetical protein
MADILPFKRLKEQQAETARQAKGHCNCTLSPPPGKPPELEWTAAGWRCSECKVIISGKRP